MNMEFWLTSSKVVLYFGMVLVLAGTIAVSILSSKVDTKKDKKIDELLNGNQLLQSSNAELHGKIDKYQLDLNIKDKTIIELGNEVDILKHYTRVSFLDYKGLSTGGGAGGLRQATEISKLLEEVVRVDDKGYIAATVEEAAEIYKNVIEQHPHFPFAYYFLAMSQKKRDDPEWKSNARKALEILTHTTKINGHFIHHDEAKDDILSWGKID